MDIVLALSELVQSIGIINTSIVTVLGVGVSFIYKNEKKQKKVLEQTVDVQNKTILDAINAQNDVLREIQRVSLNITELLAQQNGRLDSTIEIIISLALRNSDNTEKVSEKVSAEKFPTEKLSAEKGEKNGRY